MKRGLQGLFAGIILIMTILTAMAALDRGVFAAGAALWPDPWFRATLADAYFGFLTFYVWVWYKEASLPSRVAWFLLIMTLGNFAMAAYLLRELARLAPGQPIDQMLLRRAR